MTFNKRFKYHNGSNQPTRKFRIFLLGLSFILIWANPWGLTRADTPPAEMLRKHITRHDAVLIANPSGKIIFAENADTPLIPASTLKIFTAFLGFNILGDKFRFPTHFYLDDNANLKIKGYGDPLLVSEVVADIARQLSHHLKTYNDLVVDDSYFTRPLTIPGITSSFEPYDAPNGALCVNFNTVYFIKKKSGKYVSAEPQTPLLPYVINKIRASGLEKGRIIFSQQRNEIVLYAGHLFRYFLESAGVRGGGKIRIGRIDVKRDRLVYRYISRFSLKELVSKLMEHSNNFMANQILIAAGAKVRGAPGSLDKALSVGRSFATEVLNIRNLRIVEGSGISRSNRMSARMMLKVLKAFRPYHYLLRHEDGEFYKTGTLQGISTRAGYVESEGGGLFPYVIFLNSKGKRAKNLMSWVRQVIDQLK